MNGARGPRGTEQSLHFQMPQERQNLALLVSFQPLICILILQFVSGSLTATGGQKGGQWERFIGSKPSKVKATKGYFAVAKVQEVIHDPRNNDMFLAVIEQGT